MSATNAAPSALLLSLLVLYAQNKTKKK